MDIEHSMYPTGLPLAIGEFSVFDEDLTVVNKDISLGTFSPTPDSLKSDAGLPFFLIPQKSVAGLPLFAGNEMLFNENDLLGFKLPFEKLDDCENTNLPSMLEELPCMEDGDISEMDLGQDTSSESKMTPLMVSTANVESNNKAASDKSGQDTASASASKMKPFMVSTADVESNNKATSDKSVKYVNDNGAIYVTYMAKVEKRYKVSRDGLIGRVTNTCFAVNSVKANNSNKRDQSIENRKMVVCASSPAKKFQCDKCDCAYAHYPNLVRHRSGKHSLKRFICDACNDVFKRNDYLKDHITRGRCKGRCTTVLC